MTFEMWEDKGNILMLEKHEVGIDDIPDMPWYDWFTDHMTPESAVNKAINIVNGGLWV